MGTLVELVYSMFAELSRSDNSRGSDGEQQSTSKTSAEAEHGKTSDNCWEYPKAAREPGAPGTRLVELEP